MDIRRMIFNFVVVLGVTLLMLCVNDAEASGGQQKHKKILIHVPVHKKVEKHVHTIVKHIHHHHKPIIFKAEKVIHEEHQPIIKKEHISHNHDHTHHHHEKHEHPIEIHHLEEEQEHIHHHHNYEHTHGAEEVIEEHSI